MYEVVGRRRIASTSDRRPRPSAGGPFAHSREEAPGAGPVSLSVRLFYVYNLLSGVYTAELAIIFPVDLLHNLLSGV